MKKVLVHISPVDLREKMRHDSKMASPATGRTIGSGVKRYLLSLMTAGDLIDKSEQYCELIGPTKMEDITQ